MMCRWQFQVAIGDSVPKLLLSAHAHQILIFCVSLDLIR
jgi:hypothetical protein